MLAWINRDTQWGVFVWNRVREIREITAQNTWMYVPSEMNPADLPSRGCSAKQLLDSRWWEGPEWLRENENSWPNLIGKIDESEINSEKKKSINITMLNAGESVMENIITRFSSYIKLIIFFAILIEFKNFKLKREKDSIKKITLKEINSAEKKFLKYLQGQMCRHLEMTTV